MAFTLPGSATYAGAKGIRQQSADAMSALPSITNVGKDYAPFDITSGGHVPSAWEQAGNDEARDMASTALGASPAIQALRHAADERRLQAHEDEYAHEVDLAGGGPARIASMESGIENQQGDILSEGHARRQFLPYASELNARDAAAKQHALELQYIAGPQIKAQSDVDVARIGAQGHVEAARAAHAALDPIAALREAIVKRYGAGYTLSPDDLKSLTASLGAAPK